MNMHANEKCNIRNNGLCNNISLRYVSVFKRFVEVPYISACLHLVPLLDIATGTLYFLRFWHLES
jgi:hypothetical protein